MKPMLTAVVCAALAASAALPSSAGSAAVGGCRTGVLHPVGTPSAAYAAIVESHADVFRYPAGPRLARFGPVNALGYATTFSIIGAILDSHCRMAWYRVELPMRPNGIAGYVRPAAVAVQEVTTRIAVDLSARRLFLFRRGRLVLRTSVGIGAPATPTPTGRYYVDQRIVTADPSGPFGPAVLGVSAFSEVLTKWRQGGPIAIHGTDEPWSIRRAASHGCIRVANATMVRLFAAVAGGTPVIIRP